jgi:chitinase
MPDGLTEEGLRLLRMALDQGVRFERVNIMAMDYGEDYPATEPGQMAEYAKEAIEAVNKQLKELFIAYGIPFTGELYDKIGVIPMIGRNDVLNEWFYPEDAKELREFCLEKGVAMVSMWSLNRDKPISEGEPADTQIYLSTKLSPEDYGDDKFVFAKLLVGIQTSENDNSAVSDDNEDSSNQETDTSSSGENTSENSSETDSSTEEESQNTNYSLNLIDYWSGGSQYKVEVDSNNWQMKITLASGEITDIWNAEIEKAEGNTFTIIPAPWFSGSFGFIATGEEPVVTEISLNGVTQEIEQATSNLEWNVTITSDWGDGYVAQVEVKNTGDEPVFNWQLKMKLTSEITSFWGFTPEREDSTTVIVKPADYNRLIPPGGSIQFGFVAQKSGDIPYPQVQK